MNTQSNANKSEITKDLAKKISPIFEMNRAVRVANFAMELREKTFSERYELLYFLAIAVGFISQGLSSWASFVAVHSVVTLKASGDIATAVTFILLGAIEAIKFALVTICFGQIFSLRPAYPYPIILLMMLWSAFSMYLCVSGSSEIAKDKTTEVRLAKEQAGKERELKSTIAEIQNSDSYKDVVWGNGQASKVLSSVGKSLIQKRESELDSLRKTYQVKTNDFKVGQVNAQQKFQYFFGLFELLFLATTWGAFYYKRTSAIEAKLHEHSANTPEVQNGVVRVTTSQNANQTEVVREVVQTAPQNSEVLRTVTPHSTPHHSENNEVETDKNEVSGVENEVPEPTPKRNSVSKVRSEVENETHDELEKSYLELIRFANGKSQWFERYKTVVKSILECEKNGANDAETRTVCIGLHKIGKTTYYDIKKFIGALQEKAKQNK